MSDKAIYRNYKDNVFCLLYREKENLLDLYNAMHGTEYGDPEALRVVTLTNAICMRYRNDAAYTFNSDLYLYEQQSTRNPNIPLRLLHYVSDEYREIVQSENLYRQAAVKIPEPHFVCFYNGTRSQPDRELYRLSDLYEGQKEGEAPELELAVTVLNINRGHNKELLERSRTLGGYTQFVEKVRAKREDMDTEQAVREAVEECLRENILKDFFSAHREEIIDVSIYEYDEELARKAAVSDGMEIGYERGHADGRAEGRAEGVTAARRADILELLEELGEVPGEVEEKIRAQEEEETLKRWLRLAARAASLEEFARAIRQAPRPEG